MRTSIRNYNSLVKCFLAFTCLCLMITSALFFTVRAQDVNESPSVEIIQGASVRISDDGYSGIRFTATVEEAYLTGLGGYDSMGILVVPTELLGENSLEAGVENVVDIPATVFATGEEGYKTFNAVIYNVPEEDYGTEISARAYVKKTDGSYVYSTADTIVRRSLAETASLAIKDGLTDSKLFDYVDKAVTSFTMAENAVSLAVSESVALSAYVTPSNIAIIWESSDEGIATVKDGIVTAVSEGNATIYAKVGSLVKEITVNVDNDVLLGFDSLAYEQYLRSTDGFGGSWWNALEFTAVYDSAAEGSTNGAIKTTFRAGDAGQWRFSMEFLSQITPEKDIVIRFKGVDTLTNIGYNGEQGPEHPNFVGTNYWTIREDENGWKLLIIEKEGLPSELADIAFAGYAGAGEQMEIYLDYVKYGEKLPTPENLVYSDGVLRWDAVTGASKYYVEIDGVIEESVTNSYEISGNHTVRVMAVGSGEVYDSDWTSKTATVTQEEGMILSIDNETYTELFRNNNGFGGDWWNAANFTKSFDATAEGSEDGAVKLNFNGGSDSGQWRFSFSFLQSFVPEKDIVIRIKGIEAVNDIGYNGYQAGNLNFVDRTLYSIEADGETGWNLLTIKKEGLYMSINDLSLTGYTTPGGAMEIYIDYVKYV